MIGKSVIQGAKAQKAMSKLQRKKVIAQFDQQIDAVKEMKFGLTELDEQEMFNAAVELEQAMIGLKEAQLKVLDANDKWVDTIIGHDKKEEDIPLPKID